MGAKLSMSLIRNELGKKNPSTTLKYMFLPQWRRCILFNYMSLFCVPPLCLLTELDMESRVFCMLPLIHTPNPFLCFLFIVDQESLEDRHFIML